MGRTKLLDGDLGKSFGIGLKMIREERGMKQETLALAVGYSDHSQITKIEHGTTVPSLDKALRLATILHVPLEMFLRVGRGEDVTLPPLTGVAEVPAQNGEVKHLVRECTRRLSDASSALLAATQVAAHLEQAVAVY